MLPRVACTKGGHRNTRSGYIWKLDHSLASHRSSRHGGKLQCGQAEAGREPPLCFAFLTVLPPQVGGYLKPYQAIRAEVTNVAGLHEFQPRESLVQVARDRQHCSTG
jgi:hypothetical protein